MEILMLVGGHAGRIVDVKPYYARERIAAGEALDPNMPISSEVPAAPVVQVPVAIPSAVPAVVVPTAGVKPARIRSVRG